MLENMFNDLAEFLQQSARTLYAKMMLRRICFSSSYRVVTGQRPSSVRYNWSFSLSAPSKAIRWSLLYNDDVIAYN